MSFAKRKRRVSPVPRRCWSVIKGISDQGAGETFCCRKALNSAGGPGDDGRHLAAHIASNCNRLGLIVRAFRWAANRSASERLARVALQEAGTSGSGRKD